MKVSFVKTHHRRYGVHVSRDKGPDLAIYGPGHDDDLPHDLLHFVAEAEFGLDGGVFGDLAEGGNARTFIPVNRTLVPKLWRQQRIRRTRLPDGRRSEVLAGLLEEAWKARRRGRAPRAERQALLGSAGVTQEQVEALLPLLDELAARWHALAPGERLTLEWPRPERRRPHPPRQRRRPAKAR